MNFLGHSYFKRTSSLFLVGNVCGDFYKGLPNKLSLPKEMIDGIKFHRQLDILTDSTKAVTNAKTKLVDYGLFSGIIIDIYYDHFLAKNWEAICELSLEDHSIKVYKEIAKASHYIPVKSEEVVRYMIEEDWLNSYKDLDFIEETLARISKRISRENKVENSIYNLKNNYDFFEENFWEFWNELTKLKL